MTTNAARRDIVGGAITAALNADIISTTTSVVLAASPGYANWPTGTNGEFYVCFDRGNAGEEVALAASRSGATLTFANAGKRGKCGTSAASHSAGVTVEHIGSQADFDEANAHTSDTTSDLHPVYVLKSLYDANTVLAATTDNTPAALTMGASTILARLAAGNIVAANPTQVRTLLALTIGTDVQAWDADLDSLAAAGITAAGLALLDDANASAQLTTLGVSTFIKTLLDDADAATAQATLGITGSSTVCVVKSSDESVNNTNTGATLQDDNELLAAVAANTEYAFTLWLHVVSNSTVDFQLAFTAPASPTGISWSATYFDGSAVQSTVIKTVAGTAATLNFASGTDFMVNVSGELRNGANAGNLTLQWAQGNASGTNCTVKAGSWLRTQVGT